MSRFVVVIDIQNDFMRPEGKLYVPGAEEIINPISDYIRNLDSDIGVLFTYDTHFEENYHLSEESKQFPIHCVKDSWGWELSIVSEETEEEFSWDNLFYLDKNFFDMWYQRHINVYDYDDVIIAPREEFFKNLMQFDGVDTITVIGVASDYCVLDAIWGFVHRGFKVEVIRDLTKGIVRQIDQVIEEEFPQGSVIII